MSVSIKYLYSAESRSNLRRWRVGD